MSMERTLTRVWVIACLATLVAPCYEGNSSAVLYVFNANFCVEFGYLLRFWAPSQSIFKRAGIRVLDDAVAPPNPMSPIQRREQDSLYRTCTQHETCTNTLALSSDVAISRSIPVLLICIGASTLNIDSTPLFASNVVHRTCGKATKRTVLCKFINGTCWYFHTQSSDFNPVNSKMSRS